MFMAIKTITITEDAYESIKNLKDAGESFSELFLRISKKTTKVGDLLGALKLSDEDTEAMKKRIAEYRKKTSEDILERRKNVRLR
jgi:predicted CopG family antitoxin